jgi:DNA-directed RNA polymerase subunit E'/Rpb7
MESESFFQEKVYLTSEDLGSEIESIDAILLMKLKERLEEKCSSHGYVLPGTLEILTRSTGMVDFGRFSGDWSFLVKAKGKVYNPSEGETVEIEVLKSNKMGIYAIYENAIRIMVPRDLHLGNEEFDGLRVGERIRVEIQKSRFQLRDPFIVSVALYKGRVSAPTVLPLPAVAEPLEPIQEMESESKSESESESKSESESESESEGKAAE